MIAFLIVIFLSVAITVFVKAWDANVQKQNLEKQGTKVSSMFIATYLGGIPSFNITSPCDASIVLDDNIGIISIVCNDEKELISYNNVKTISNETKESLSALRLLAIGIFAFAFKSKTNYFRITYTNDINEEVTIVFQSNSSPAIVSKILNHRYNYLQSNINEEVTSVS